MFNQTHIIQLVALTALAWPTIVSAETTSLPPEGEYVPNRVVVGFRVPASARNAASTIEELEATGIEAVKGLLQNVLADTPECISNRPLLQDTPGPVIPRPASKGNNARSANAVAFSANMPPAAKKRLATPPRRVENPLKYIHVLEFEPGTDLLKVIQRIEARPEVAFAEVDGLRRTSFTPDDPFFQDGELWGMERIKAPEAWSVTTGSTVARVAVIDSGIDFTHPDLAGPRLINGRDFADEDDDSSDQLGHGTHVAGTVGAMIDNGLGVAGVAQCEVMGVKVFTASGFCSAGWVADAITYAVDNGAHILNLSLSGASADADEEEAVDYAVANGCLVVCSAGNDNGPVGYPAAYANSFAVGGTTARDHKYGYSNHGPELDIAAPGVGIWSTTMGGGYASWNGTSMATPHVAGAAALLKSQNPALTAADIRYLLESTADDLGSPGWDPFFGHGIINLQAAFAAMSDILTISTASVLPDGQIGTPYTPVSLAASGGYSPYTWQTLPLEIQTLATTELTEGSYREWRADEQVWPIALPFAFPYGGTTYSTMWVSSNGFLQFSETTPTPDHANSSYQLGLHARVAPLWDDLATDGIINRPEDIYIEQPTSDSFMIRWQAHTYELDTPVNVACVLFLDGRIRFDYGEGNTQLTPTVGLGFGGGQRILASGYDGANDLGNAGSLLFIPNSLPSGMTLSESGELAGTPIQGGIFNVRVEAEDAIEQTKEQTFSLFINDPATQPPRILSILPSPGNQMWSNKQPDPVQVDIVFNEDVTISAADISVVGDTTGTRSFDFTYDSSTFMAMLLFDGPLADDTYTFTIYDSMTDGDGMALDGEIVEDQLPSGDLIQGGDAVWTLEIMPWWGEFRVNTFTEGCQERPKIAMDVNGDFIVTWTGPGPDDSDGGVYWQRFSANGAHLGTQTRVNTYTEDLQGHTDIAMHPSGGFVIVWDSYGQDGDREGVYARRYDAEAQPLDEVEFLVNTTTNNQQYLPRIAMDAAGNFVVVWTSTNHDSDGPAVCARRYDASGQPQGGEFQINSYELGSQLSPAIGMWPNGDFVVAWWTLYEHCGGDGYDIAARRYNTTGVPLSDEFQVNTYEQDYQMSPDVAVGADGSFIVGWHSDAPAHYGAFAQRYLPTGVPLGSEFEVGPGGIPIMSIGAAGDFFVVCGSGLGLDGDGGSVSARHYDSSGQLLREEFRVNTYTIGHQVNPHVVRDADDNYVIAWQSYEQDGSHYGIYAQCFPTLPPVVMSAMPIPNSVISSSATTTIGVTFSEDVVIDETQVSVLDDRAIEHNDFTLSYNAETFTATLHYVSALPAGRTYRVTVDDSVYRRDPRPGITQGVDDFQVFLDGDWEDMRKPSGDGEEGGDAVWSFTVSRDAPWEGESRINREIAGTQASASAAGLRDDLFVAAWASNDSDGDGWGIIAGRFDQFGYPVRWETIVNQTKEGDQRFVDVAAFRNGDYVVVWSGTGTGDDQGVFIRKFDAEGVPLTDEILVNEYTADEQAEPSVSVSEDGPIVVAWHSFGAGKSRSDFGIVARILSEDLSFVTGDLAVNTVTTGNQIAADVAWLTNGTFVIVWQRPAGDHDGIFGQAYDVEGLKVGGEFAVSTNTLHEHTYAQVAALPDGGCLVAWTEEDTLSDRDIMARAFDADRVGDPEFIVNEYTDGNQYAVALERLSGADLIVSWQSAAQSPPGDTSGQGVYYRRIDWEETAPLGPETVANTYYPGNQVSPTIGGLASGDFVVVWDGEGPFSDYTGIYARWFDATPPTITSMSTFTSRGGIAGIVFEFSEAVSVDTAQLNIVGDSTGDRAFEGEYDDHAWRLTITFYQALPADNFTITISTSGVIGSTGSTLDGDGDGLMGDDLVVTLSTNGPGDFNHDGQLDMADLPDFVAALLEGTDETADMNEDDLVDGRDVQPFLDAVLTTQ